MEDWVRLATTFKMLRLSLYFLPCDLTAGHFCHIVTLWLFFKHTRKTFFEDKILFVKPITYWCCLFSWNLRAISLQSLFLYVYHPFIAFLHFLQIFISTKFNFLTKTRFYVLLLTDSSANTPAFSAANLRLVFPSLEKLASHALLTCVRVCVSSNSFLTQNTAILVSLVGKGSLGFLLRKDKLSENLVP